VLFQGCASEEREINSNSFKGESAGDWKQRRLLNRRFVSRRQDFSGCKWGCNLDFFRVSSGVPINTSC
jgi:hypothetical protein